MYSWSPWNGCHKLSDGCRNCYIHGNRSEMTVEKSPSFDAPVARNKKGEYKFKSGQVVATCFRSDFFVEDADEWRTEAWKMIHERPDLHFFMITKRIDRFYVGLPDNWGDGYDNVTICTTVENQDRADYRLPIFKNLPIKHKQIVCEPLLEKIDLSAYLGDWAKQVAVGGESGKDVRLCNYDWILNIREQCIEKDIPFQFRQTGSKFVKGGEIFNIYKKFQYVQARKANIDYKPLPVFYHKEEGNSDRTKEYYPTLANNLQIKQ